MHNLQIARKCGKAGNIIDKQPNPFNTYYAYIANHIHCFMGFTLLTTNIKYYADILYMFAIDI